MRKHWTVVPTFMLVVISLALTGILFTQDGVALAQDATPAPAEEVAPTAVPAEEAAPAAPTAAPVEEAAPAAPTATPVEEAAPAEEAPVTMPTTGAAGNSLIIILVVAGTVMVLGTLAGYSARRQRTHQG